MHENKPEFHRKIIMSDETQFTLEATLISRIVAFGAQKIQKWLLKSLSIRNVYLFGAVFGQKGSLGLIFMKIKLERLFWWMDCAIEPWLTS